MSPTTGALLFIILVFFVVIYPTDFCGINFSFSEQDQSKQNASFHSHNLQTDA